MIDLGDAGPAEMRARIEAFVRAHPADALDRSCAEGHLTGSALVLSTDRTRALLMHHRKLDRWLQMGGHADGDPDLAAVALREATEESGIAGLRLLNGGRPVDLDVHLVEPPGEAPHHHYDVRFLAIAPAGAMAVGNDESHELRWFDLDDVATVGDPGLVRLALRSRCEQ